MRALVVGAFGGAIAVQAFAATPIPPVEQNGWLVYQDSHISQTAPCTQQPILLNGSHTDFTLNGACENVRVAGEHNDISIQVGPAATIEITGAHNDVTWQQVIPGPPPHLLDSGTSNTFHHGE
jgi:Protein of unknown function (DUF3060)